MGLISVISVCDWFCFGSLLFWLLLTVGFIVNSVVVNFLFCVLFMVLLLR